MDPNVHILEYHPGGRGEETNDVYSKIGGNDWRYAVLKEPVMSYGSVGLQVEHYIETQSTTVPSALREKKKAAFALLDRDDHAG